MNLHEAFVAAAASRDGVMRSCGIETADTVPTICSTIGYRQKNILRNTAGSTTKNGVTFTVSSDGSIKANGTATSQVLFKVGDIQVSKETAFTLSGCPRTGSSSTYELYCRNESGYISGTDEYGSGKTFTASSDFSVYITIKANTTVSNLVFYPMLRYASNPDSTYEAYRLSVSDRLALLESRVAALEASH